nr:hypothetical protein [Tanacetum cinerariifolium]
MDSQSAPVVSAAKLPILNPNEFDLWKMRIEQYSLMTDYSLWEVIINGDSVISRVAVDDVAQLVTVLTAEQKLARKNELKARGTLLMALPDKHQLKFNSHKDAKTLMEANLEEHSLDDLFNSLKIYETEVRHSSSPSNPTQNLAFVSSSNTDSTTDSVSAATSVFAVYAKLPMSSHLNIDSLSNAVIFSFFANGDANYEARIFLQKTGRNLGDNRVTTMGFDMSKVECYNCHRKGHFTKECRSPKDTRRTGGAEPHRRTAPVETSTSNALVSQCDGIGSYDWSYQAEEEPANFALMAISSSSFSDNEAALESVESRLVMYKQNESIFQENIIVLKNEVEARDNFIITLKQKLKQAEIEKDDLKLKFKKFQSSSKSLTKLIASHTNNKHDLGYLSSKDNSKSVSLTCPSDRLSPSCGYHVVPPPVIGNFMPPKPDLVFNTAPLAVESDHSDFNPIKVPILAATSRPTIKTDSSGKRKNRKTCFVCRSVDHLIKDCNFHVKPQTKSTPRNSAHRGCNKQYASFTKKYPQKHKVPAAVLSMSKPVSVTAIRQVSAAVPKIMKSRPRPAHPLNRKFNPSIRSRCSRHMTGNISYLSDFQELNGGYVAFGGNPKGGKISDFKLPDESQVLLRVPRENNMYNVNLKDIVHFGDLTYLFVKATIDESNLWHRRLGHINFKTINILVKGNLVRGLPTKVFENHNTCVACNKGKQHKASYKTKPVSSINQPLFRLHMDLSGPTFVKSLNKKNYCLVITDDYSRFTWNRVLVTKPHNKTPYELLHGRTPSIGFMRPFGYLVTILNTLDTLGKFKGKVDEGFLVGYSVNSKAFKVFNSRTCIIQETLHVNFLENKPNVAGIGPTWLFDINSLTKIMNYQPVTAGNQTNPSAGFQDTFDADKAGKEANLQYVLFLVWSTSSSNPQNKEGDTAFDEHEHNDEKPESAVNLSLSRSALSGEKDDMTKKKDKGKSPVEYFSDYRDLNTVFEDFFEDSSNNVSAASPIVLTAGQHYSNSTNPISAAGPIVNIAGYNYSNSTNPISTAGPSNSNSSLTLRQSSLRDTYQPPDMVEREDIVYSDHENVGVEADFNNLETSITIKEPKRVHQALKDPSWIEAMQEEFLQFKMKKVWILVDLPHGKRAIGFEDPDHPDKVYKVVKALYGLHQAPRAWYKTLATYLLENGFHRGQIDQTLFIKKQKGDILLMKIYVDDIIFGATNKDLCKSFKKLMNDKIQMSSMGELAFFLGKSASTPIDTEKPLLKDPDGEDFDVHIYRSMIGSLMYLTSSRPDIMFAFWRTVAIKSSNDVTRLQALVDKKRVVVTKAAIRDGMHLDDAEGVDCLPNEEIFTELARIGYKKPTTKLTFFKAFFSSQWKFLIHTILQSMSAKRTSWNEFSSTMASVMICLSTGDLSTHSTKYISPALTQKVFANTRRVGKGYSGVETPLFEGMLVAREPEEQGDAEEQGDVEEHGNEEEHGNADITTEEIKHDEALDACAALARRVEHLEQDKVAHNLEIIKLKIRVKKLEKTNKAKTLKLRRLRKVRTSQRVDTSNDTLMEDVSNQGRVIDRDADAIKEIEEVREYTTDTQVEGRQADIYHIDMNHAAKVLKVVSTVSETVSDAAVIPSAVLETISVAAIPTVTAAPVKVDAPVKAAVPFTRRKRGVVIWDLKEESSAKILLKIPPRTREKSKEQIEEEESRAIAIINETPAHKATKRRKLIEKAKEAKSIKQHLQIVPDEDDDVFTKATPLAKKVPVVDSQIPHKLKVNQSILLVVLDLNPRQTLVTKEASGPFEQPQDNTSINVVRDTPSLAAAETRADTKKSNNEGDTEILNVDEERGENISNTVALKERTIKLDEGKAGSDPGNTHYILLRNIFLENPQSSFRTLSSMKNLDDAFTYGDQFLYDKPMEEEPGKANVETEVESMFTFPIHQASSSVHPLSTPVIDSPPKLVSPPVQEPIFTSTTSITTTTLLPPPPPQQPRNSVPDPELSYNQNYDGNYYSHASPSFPCCDYCGESHETYQCQPMDQNIDFSGSDQIQNLQYPNVQENPLTNDEFEAYTNANNDNINNLQIKFDHFQKKVEQKQDDFLNQMRNFMQNLYDGLPIPPPEDSEEQKRSMEYTILELVKICQEKEFLCIHDNVDDLIESTLNSKLLLINSNSQHLDNKEQEVKNAVEQPAERGSRSIRSLPNFRVVHKKPEHLLSMGYEPNAKNLLPISSKCEVTLEDEIECDMPAKDVCSPIFTTFSNPLFKDNDDLDSSNNESFPVEDVPAEEFKIYSNPLFDEDEINSDKLDPHYFNVESYFVESLLNRETFIEISSKFDLSGELAHIKLEIPKSDFDFEEEIRRIENLLYDNSFLRLPKELNAEIADTIIESIPLLPVLVQDGNSQQEEIDVVTETDDVLHPSVENDDDSLDDPLLEEADLFLSDNSIPPGIENVADDPEGDVRFLEELLIDNFILSHESFDSNFEDNPSIPRPPPESPDAETDTGEEILVVMIDRDKFDDDY